MKIRKYKSKYNILKKLITGLYWINHYKGKVLPTGWISSGEFHTPMVGGSCADRRIRELRQIKGINIEAKFLSKGLPNGTWCYKLISGEHTAHKLIKQAN